MHASFQKRSAFTFVELLIVILIMAILAVALSIAYQRVQLRVRFDAHEAAVNDFFQRARAHSLNTIILDETEPVLYYELLLNQRSVTLNAVGATLTEELDSYDFGTDISLDGDYAVYYFPPSGDVCLTQDDCSSTDSELTVTLSDSSATFSTEFTVQKNGGYVEVNPLLP